MGTIGKVRDRSRKPSGRSVMGRETLGEIRDGVWGPSGWSRTGRKTLGEVWDMSGDLQGGPGMVG